MIRKPLILALSALVLLGACGTAANNPVRGALSNSLKQLVNRKNQEVLTTASIRTRLTPELRAQIGVPTMIAELPDLKVAAPIVYAEQNGGHVTWLAPDGVGMTTRQGMLVSTRGIGFDLMAAHIEGPLAMVKARKTGSATRVQTYLDGEDQVQPLRFTCSYGPSIGSKGQAHVSEFCENGDLAIQNQYWLNAKNEIFKSIQWAGARNGYLLLEGPILP